MVELEEELANECSSRTKSNVRCHELEKELEDLKTELFDSLDTTAAEQEERWGPPVELRAELFAEKRNH